MTDSSIAVSTGLAMQEATFVINGITVRGYQFWRHNTIPPHLEGTTHASALDTVLKYPPRRLKCSKWEWDVDSGHPQ